MSETFTLAEKHEIISKLHDKVASSYWLRIDDGCFTLKDLADVRLRIQARDSHGGGYGGWVEASFTCNLEVGRATVASLSSNRVSSDGILQSFEMNRPQLPEPETKILRETVNFLGFKQERVTKRVERTQMALDQYDLRMALWNLVSKFISTMHACEPSAEYKKVLDKRQQEQARIEEQRASERRILDKL